MKTALLIVFGILCLSKVTSDAQQSRNLDIYWIDVEGGAATLIVTPDGESVLMDAGWSTEDDRDAKRILAAMQDAGISTLDYFIVSHFHDDHIGGLPALARQISIGQFLDYGDGIQQNDEKIRKGWEDYVTIAKEKRRILGAGDTIVLEGVDFTIVSSHGEVIPQTRGQSQQNSLCDKASLDVM